MQKTVSQQIIFTKCNKN